MIDNWRNAAAALAGVLCGYAYATDRLIVAILLALVLFPWAHMASFTWGTIVDLVDWKRSREFSRITR